MTAPELNYLDLFWPLFILAEQGPPAEGASLASLVAPEQPAEIRAVFGPIFERTNPTAARGLEIAEDAELVYWGRIFRAARLTAAEGEGTFMPAWLTHNGQVQTALAQVVRLPFCERLDVFLAAMHQKGLA